ncbi:MAG: hypothetical protein H9847_05110 [Candidatus Anaerobiospirillum pullicola]|uniref:Outer membrane protein beta-barrel domain-containing protein n=1 Tax=Candidatus Anaerobiospirillum pullicola TaxID=2838451 RepID=A0A948TG59_9GAMM|nr:hypothetical protein [Candidatus Anaerobiospirillum pullicola]
MNYKKMAAAVALGSLTLLGASALSSAQAANVGGLRFNANYTGTGEADIKGSNESLQTNTFTFDASYAFATFIYSHTEYDFSGYDDPFDSLDKVAIDLHHNGYISSNLAYGVGLTLGALYEEDFDIGDSYNVSPRAVLGWTFKNGMTAFLGAFANLNGADNVYLPIVGLKLGDDSDHGWMGSIAYPATMVQYRFNDWLAVGANFMTVRDTYHLDDDWDRKGDWADGYLREESYGAGLSATLSPMKMFKVTAGVFSYFDREFKVYNSSGDEIDSFETDNTWGGYLRAGFSF